MNRRLFGAFGVLAVVAFSLGGCKSDPLSDLDGNPAAVITDFSYLQLPVGSTAAVTASVLDARTTPLDVPITFTPCTGDISVVVDTSYHPVPRTSARAIVLAEQPANSCLVVSGGGIQDTVAVTTLPVAFDGVISTTTPLVGDTLTLVANALLSFDPATADIDFGDGVRGTILVRNADTLMVRVPQPDAAQPAVVTVDGVLVPYVTGLIVSLPLATPLNVQSPFGAHESPGQASATITIPADGDSLVFYDGYKSDGLNYFWPFTIASTDTITFTLSWDTDADLDMASCNGEFVGCIGGFGAATTANPETFTVTYPPGSYHLFIQQFDTHDEPAHLFKVVVRNP